MAKSQKIKLRENLQNQLNSLGKVGFMFDDMVEDYIKLWQTKNELFKDIKENGVTIFTTNGNGFDVKKQNDSVTNVLKVNNQMLKILNEMGMKQPLISPPSSPNGDEDDKAYLQ